MAKSSIHIEPIKANSETHNLRLKDYKHVDKNLTHLNFNYHFDQRPIKEIKKELESIYKAKIGQRMQKKSTPIREGVFLFEERHTDEELKKVVEDIGEKYGIRPLQLHVHRDEGHPKSRHRPGDDEWKPNLHAHVVFEWFDRNTGKTMKLNREKLSNMQTDFATALGMERGQKSTKRHLNSLEFKVKKLKEELEYIINHKIKVIDGTEAQIQRLVDEIDDLEKKSLNLSKNEKNELKAYRKLAEKNPKIKTAVNKILNFRKRKI